MGPTTAPPQQPFDSRRLPPRAPFAMRRVPQRNHTVTIHGPPSSTGRPTHAFQRPPPVPRDQHQPFQGRGWSTWMEVAIRIRGLPSTITTYQLWEVFHEEGPLDSIELYEDGRGNKNGNARLKFRPPPDTAFWRTGTYELHSEDGMKASAVEVFLEEPKSAFLSQSPANPEVRFPERTTIALHAMDVGFMYQSNTMMSMRHVEARDNIRMELELNLFRRLIDVTFDFPVVDPRDPAQEPPLTVNSLPSDLNTLGALNRMEKYRFRIPIEQLHKIEELDVRAGTRSFVISLDTPPNYYRKAVGAQLQASHSTRGTFWNEWDTWFRTTDVLYNPTEMKDAKVALKKTKPLIDIGRWTTFRFSFKYTSSSEGAYKTICAALRDYNVQIKPCPDLSFAQDVGPAVWEWIDKPVSKSTAAASFLADLQEPTVPLLPFPVRYMLEACISQGCLNEHNLDKGFVERLATMEQNKASDMLEWVLQQKTRIYEPMTIFDMDFTRGTASRTKIPHYCTYSRKATVTPSMVYYGVPSIDISNRVVRQYAEYADRFLRVQFTDEKFQGRINSTDKKTSNEILTRIQRTMTNGILIGDRHFEFLAFGNSQFREHGAYFFAPTMHLKTTDIRQWMGNFSSIRTPAKYAARLGQCFSTTRAINGARVTVKEIADVVRGEFNFTDGVGKISGFLAQMIAGELRVGHVPSVFQFRLGGCKGVLTTWPDARHHEVHIRPSQYKFAAVHNGLEINRWSQFGAASLNRQIIIVLSTLGVPDDVFKRNLDKMMDDLGRAMHEETQALHMLQRYIDPNQMTLTLAGLILDGFMTSKEPFMMSLLQLWRAWSIKYLKEKARILVDKGAFLLGCTDETQTLKGHFEDLQVGCEAPEDERLKALPEIFVQVPNPDRPGQYTVIEGLCLLARNPSLHPGDIRIVRAVDNLKLRHLRDVVVLPQTGDRDVASMCSGGDLDGDDFLVIWDKEFIPPEWNHPPMDYTPDRPNQLNRDVEIRDIINFFVNYMKNDRLGTIAHSHLAHGDRSSDGIKAGNCLELAALHSKAVDYVKSGEPAEMPKELKPRAWPHFMEKRYVAKGQTYVSGKILGQLYDKVDRRDFVPIYDKPFDSRILLAYEPDHEMMTAARDLKDLYDTDMRRIMAQYDIRTEFEIWSTFAMQFINPSKDYKFHEEMGQIASTLKDRYRAACVEQAGSQTFEVLGPFVTAMYRVTEEQVNAALEECRAKKIVGGKEVAKRLMKPESMPLISFPWCFPEVLGKIATGSASTSTERKIKQASVEQPKQQTTMAPLPNIHEEDIVETADGVTHRGDLLELFNDGDVAEPCLNSLTNVDSASNDLGELNGLDFGSSKETTDGGGAVEVEYRGPDDQWLGLEVLEDSRDGSRSASSFPFEPERDASLEQSLIGIGTRGEGVDGANHLTNHRTIDLLDDFETYSVSRDTSLDNSFQRARVGYTDGLTANGCQSAATAIAAEHPIDLSTAANASRDAAQEKPNIGGSDEPDDEVLMAEEIQLDDIGDTAMDKLARMVADSSTDE
ncbi:MAG: hypothetical protein M1817_001431 [Caeruleum heppii]|nr:MAG: hypothetical protein M1817_001431 [Caeruleum heppii]